MRDPTEQKIGIIGGGQLGKMMILEAKKMDFHVTILDPTPHCPAHSIADEHIVADFKEAAALRKLARQSDVVTYEFEHIDVVTLKELKSEGHDIYPAPRSLEIIQNKYHQKQLLKQEGLPVPEFVRVTDRQELDQAADQFGYPFMLKSCKGGYDGKGNALVESESELESSYQALGAEDNLLMAEEYVPFAKEISVIVCRGIEGEIVTYPIGENKHQESILLTTKVPADISSAGEEKALKLGKEIMEVFSGVGIFCIEMFVTNSGEVLINEIAPRPHNSGHYSIEGCVTSQFANHMRAIAGLPLGSTQLVRPAVMRNILGQEEVTGTAQISGLQKALQQPQVKVHIYGKQVSRPKRKMGHLTATADELATAEQKSLEARNSIKITGERSG